MIPRTTELLVEEIRAAAAAGVARHVFAIANGKCDRYGAEFRDPWSIDIGGAIGEMAVAKFLGQYWTGLGFDRNDPDVGRCVECRWKPDENSRLPLRPRDHDYRPYVLVTGRVGKTRLSVTLRGWILAGHGKVDEFRTFDEFGPRWDVPQARLNDVAELVGFLNRHPQHR